MQDSTPPSADTRRHDRTDSQSTQTDPTESRSPHAQPVDRLTPTTPKEGQQIYLDARSRDLTPTTLQAYERTLDRFRKFLDEKEVGNLNDLTGRLLHEYRLWVRENGSSEVEELSNKTMRDEMYTLKNFLRYLETLDAVPTGLHQKLQIPTLDPGDGVRDRILAADRVERIIDYLDNYHYATREHVTWVLLATTGARTGAIQSLDLGDCKFDDGSPYVEFRDRPDRGTTLKQGHRSERDVTIPQWAVTVIEDWIAEHRPDVTDSYGRDPLLATRHGRISKSVIRRYIYKWTRPCAVGRDCPHDRDPATCEAAESSDTASGCPSVRSPHDIRRGYLTEELDAGLPPEILTDRCDLTQEVLEKHYDQRSEAEKRRLREELMREVGSEFGSGYHFGSETSGGDDGE